MSSPKLFLFIGMSLDGYIATKDDDLSWMDVANLEGEDYGYGEVQKRTGTYIIGRRTYDVVLKLTGGDFPQADMYDCYIVTREKREPKDGVTFFNGDVVEFIKDLKSKPGKDIYCDGGGGLIHTLLKENLVDEFQISVLPILLGDGISLFKEGFDRIHLKATSSNLYDSGVTVLKYENTNK